MNLNFVIKKSHKNSFEVAGVESKAENLIPYYLISISYLTSPLFLADLDTTYLNESETDKNQYQLLSGICLFLNN